MQAVIEVIFTLTHSQEPPYQLARSVPYPTNKLYECGKPSTSFAYICHNMHGKHTYKFIISVNHFYLLAFFVSILLDRTNGS